MNYKELIEDMIKDWRLLIKSFIQKGQYEKAWDCKKQIVKLEKEL